MRLGNSIINPYLDALCQRCGIKNYYLQLGLAYLLSIVAMVIFLIIGIIALGVITVKGIGLSIKQLFKKQYELSIVIFYLVIFVTLGEVIYWLMQL